MRLPAPDPSSLPQFVPELKIADVVYSEDGFARVVIAVDPRKIFHLHPERWDVSDFTVTGEAFWNSWQYRNSMTDELETAREMAQEVLRGVPRSQVVPE